MVIVDNGNSIKSKSPFASNALKPLSTTGVWAFFIGDEMRICSRCYKSKEESEYYKRPNTKCGLRSECRECSKRLIKQWRKEHPNSEQNYKRKWRREHPIKVKKINKKWADKNRFKIRTHSKSFYACITGRLIKPIVCVMCGTKNERIEGHHSDYLEPLEITWVCCVCHKSLHKKSIERE